MKGYLSIVLHSHLPYVLTHGVWPHGADWLNECCAETYIPLLNVCFQLVSEGISPKITIGLTPVLCEQLADPAFVGSFTSYVDQKIESAVLNADEFARTGLRDRAQLAEMWRDYYIGVRRAFLETFDKDLVGAFRRLQDDGHVEIITSAATHAYLPLLYEDDSIDLQIAAGKANYEKYFGREPFGIWLPECAYRPGYRWSSPVAKSGDDQPRSRKGIEYYVAKNGIQYFIIDSHLLRGGKPIGTYLARFDALKRLWKQIEAQYVPRPQKEDLSPCNVYWVGSGSGDTGVAFFTRDPGTGVQVWSGEQGYPGSAEYLDFHKKHFPGGLRYWRVTGPKMDLGEKQPYSLEPIEGRLREHAHHFLGLVVGNLKGAQLNGDRPGVVCAPFDAELFGHWWFEGPRWIYHLAKAAHESKEVSLITCGEYLHKFPPSTVVDLPEGSWGEGGFHFIWLNKDTEWTWRHVHAAEGRMKALLAAYGKDSDPLMRRALAQAARELLLLESSDWQFLISTWSARDYAQQRFAEHDACFNRLAELAERYATSRDMAEDDLNYLRKCERIDPIFPELKLTLRPDEDSPRESG
ncbi:MAG: hypothetical protein DRH70_04735 [Candidatus Coatesbacteria bacterium]|nr:MAG: hypothetical protein DRH70_04735 [Candidatus Coatesbacteria bacterium]